MQRLAVWLSRALLQRFSGRLWVRTLGREPGWWLRRGSSVFYSSERRWGIGLERIMRLGREMMITAAFRRSGMKSLDSLYCQCL